MSFLLIFGAKYLFLAGVLLTAIVFFRLPVVKRKSVAWLGVISFPVAFIISRIVSHFFNNPRPFVVGRFVPLIAHAADNGFPSDHALLVSALAMLFWWSNRRMSLLLWVLAIAVGLSRVLVGVHHLVDIVGSMVIVIVTFVAVRWVVKSVCIPSSSSSSAA